jgi:hypothetical protein
MAAAVPTDVWARVVTEGGGGCWRHASVWGQAGLALGQVGLGRGQVGLDRDQRMWGSSLSSPLLVSDLG